MRIFARCQFPDSYILLSVGCIVRLVVKQAFFEVVFDLVFVAFVDFLSDTSVALQLCHDC